MTIRREDLAAAAAVGLLHYRQVEPLRVFLLQRDVRARREAMLAQLHPAPLRRVNAWLLYLLGALALLTALLFSLLFAGRALQSTDGLTPLLFAVPYGVAVLALAAWFRRRGLRARARMLAGLMVASVPLAVVALHHAAG